MYKISISRDKRMHFIRDRDENCALRYHKFNLGVTLHSYKEDLRGS